jgi:hypothetical protein
LPGSAWSTAFPVPSQAVPRLARSGSGGAADVLVMESCASRAIDCPTAHTYLIFVAF